MDFLYLGQKPPALCKEKEISAWWYTAGAIFGGSDEYNRNESESKDEKEEQTSWSDEKWKENPASIL